MPVRANSSNRHFYTLSLLSIQQNRCGLQFYRMLFFNRRIRRHALALKRVVIAVDGPSTVAV